MKKICIVAGEASGDLHGANLVKALKAQRPDLRVFGSGGPLMKAVLDAPFIESARINVTGFTEVIRHIPAFLKLFETMTAAILREKPDLIVFMDNPGFNLRLAKKLSEAGAGVPMAYYICPQIWSWNAGRVHLMKRLFRKALVVFDFEQEIYKDNQMPVAWVGHPLRDVLRDGQYPRKSAPNPAAPRIALLPGSRQNEVSTLLPILLDAAANLARRFPQAKFTLVKADTLPDSFYEPILSKKSVRLESVRGSRYATVADSDVALVCSGPATLECALLETPMIIVNRVSLITYLIARLVIRVPFLGLPNLLSESEIVPELLQYNCTSERIAEEAAFILEDPARSALIRKHLREVSDRVGPPGASANASRELLTLL